MCHGILPKTNSFKSQKGDELTDELTVFTLVTISRRADEQRKAIDS